MLSIHLMPFNTGWRRLIGCLKLQFIFRKRATNYRALLRKMTYEDKASHDSTPLWHQMPSRCNSVPIANCGALMEKRLCFCTAVLQIDLQIFRFARVFELRIAGFLCKRSSVAQGSFTGLFYRSLL